MLLTCLIHEEGRMDLGSIDPPKKSGGHVKGKQTRETLGQKPNDFHGYYCK